MRKPKKLYEMAKRLLRDWTDSEAVDSLSVEAEVFFTRLIMKADDYGSFHANPKLLKAALFPLKEITFLKIGAWVHECIHAGLIFLYEVKGREYIRIIDFGQRLQNKRNAFPHPETDSPRSTVIPRDSPTEREVEEKKEVEEELEREVARDVVFVDENVPRGLRIILPDKNEIFEEIFSDELFVEELKRGHPKKNIQKAWDECWLYHSQKPSPPTLGWQWRQKLSTWLINTKDERASKNKHQRNTDSLAAGFAARHGTDAN